MLSCCTDVEVWAARTVEDFGQLADAELLDAEQMLEQAMHHPPLCKDRKCLYARLDALRIVLIDRGI